jgi:hypothetical protein
LQIAIKKLQTCKLTAAFILTAASIKGPIMHC